MVKDNDTNFYSVNIKYNSGREYNGKIGYSRQQILKHRKARLAKKESKKALVIVTLVGSLAAYKDVKHAVSNTAERIEQYYESQKPYAYTNMTDSELKSLGFEETVKLYQDYFDFVKSTAPTVTTPATYDFDKILSNTNLALEEYEIFKSNQDIETVSSMRQSILNQLKSADAIITKTYNGQYMLTTDDPNIKYYHDKSELFNTVAMNR